MWKEINTICFRSLDMSRDSRDSVSGSGSEEVEISLDRSDRRRLREAEGDKVEGWGSAEVIMSVCTSVR